MRERILLAHGGGGRLSSQLIEDEILPRFGSGPLGSLPDGATIQTSGKRLVVSTDSFVVTPLRFPGGSIGDLAVNGTVNDISVCGATPQYLTLAMILEEGLLLDDYRSVLDDIAKAAGECGVTIITGDTKVVPRGQCDGMYITTTGIGMAHPCFALDRESLRPGDRVLINGTIGDHGMAVMAARENLPFDSALHSDTAPVHRLVEELIPFGPEIRFMRDPTRGGVATVLNEIVNGGDRGVELVEENLPFAPQSAAISEMLGIDLLHSASEGRLICICAPGVADDILARWRIYPEGKGSTIIGEVTTAPGRVSLQTAIGGKRMVDTPQGELLPRIC